MTKDQLFEHVKAMSDKNCMASGNDALSGECVAAPGAGRPLSSNTRVAALRHLHDKLKSGEYDGTDVMAAWIAVEDLACLLERATAEPGPILEHEAIGSRARGTSPNRSCGTAGQSGIASSLPKFKVGDSVEYKRKALTVAAVTHNYRLVAPDYPPGSYVEFSEDALCSGITKCDVPKCIVTDCGQDATKDGSWCEKHSAGSHIWP